MQTEKLWLNHMTTNLPAKTATAMVVLAAATVEMVRGGRKREKVLDR
jgi:hypothetical protein